MCAEDDVPPASNEARASERWRAVGESVRSIPQWNHTTTRSARRPAARTSGRISSGNAGAAPDLVGVASNPGRRTSE